MKYLIAILMFVSSVLNVHAQEKLYPNEFNLSDVKLLDGPFKHARDLNIQTLLKYNVDRLLAPYLKEAGLKPNYLDSFEKEVKKEFAQRLTSFKNSPAMQNDFID